MKNLFGGHDWGICCLVVLLMDWSSSYSMLPTTHSGGRMVPSRSWLGSDVCIRDNAWALTFLEPGRYDNVNWNRVNNSDQHACQGLRQLSEQRISCDLSGWWIDTGPPQANVATPLMLVLWPIVNDLQYYSSFLLGIVSWNRMPPGTSWVSVQISGRGWHPLLFCRHPTLLWMAW